MTKTYDRIWCDLDETPDSWGYGDITDFQAKAMTLEMRRRLEATFPGIRVSILRGAITSSKVGGDGERADREAVREWIEANWLAVLRHIMDGPEGEP